MIWEISSSYSKLFFLETDPLGIELLDIMISYTITKQ